MGGDHAGSGQSSDCGIISRFIRAISEACAARSRRRPQNCRLKKQIHRAGSMEVYGEAAQASSTGAVHLIADYQSPQQKPGQSQRGVTSFGYRRCLASVRDWQARQVRCQIHLRLRRGGETEKPTKKKINWGSLDATPLSRRYLLRACATPWLAASSIY